VRFRATFRPISGLTANSVSKAIIRAGLDEFLRAHWDQVNRTYYYFPSYEIVTDMFRDPFDEDAKHPHETVIAQVLDVFARQYTSLGRDGGDAGLDESFLPDQLRRIEELEARNAELRRICDERLTVIHELAEAAQQRLDLINRLDAHCRQLAQRTHAGR
jgi:hypothetical protein